MPTSTSSRPPASTPWVEKYRPKNLTDVSHQNEVIKTLQNAVETDRLPHLLFYGPPGIGKTSVALALCRTLWHPSQWKRRVLELNASDERGISVVRDKIKHFASLAVGSSSGGKRGVGGFFGKDKAKGDAMEEDKKEESEEINYPNPPFKIIILDEADTVTPDAQAALRRIIEAHSKITRFVLICNYVTRIIEPLASRCAKFRFQPLPPDSMRDRLHFISKEEGCRYATGTEDDVIDEILRLSKGDMRRAVMMLQSAFALSGGGDVDEDTKGGIIGKDSIAEMAGLPPSSVISELIDTLRSGTFDTTEAAVTDVIAEGYSVQDVLSELLTAFITDSRLTDVAKSDLSIKIAEVDKNLVDGADEVLQLLTVCSLALRRFSDSTKKAT